MLRCSLRRLQQATARNVPGPSGPEEWLSHGNFTDMHSHQVNLEKAYGNVFRLPATCLGKEVWHVSHPHDVQRAMSVEGPYPTAIGASFAPWAKWDKERALREGTSPMIGVAEGEEWKSLRNKLQKPIFNPKDIMSYLPNISKVAESSVPFLPRNIERDGLKVALYSLVADMSTSMILGRPVGLSGEHPLPKGHKCEKFLELSEQSMVYLMQSVLSPEHAVQFATDPDKCIPYLKFKQAAERIQDVLNMLINDSIEVLESGSGEELEAAERSYVALLLRQGQLDRADFTPSVSNFLNAGVDSTSAQFQWMLWLMATNPEVQAELREKTFSALGGQPGAPQPLTPENYDKCGHLRRAFKEMTRLHPALNGTMRKLNEDIVVGDEEYLIPAGTEINLLSIATRTDPAIWGDDALEFKPERWNREAEDPIKPVAPEKSQRVYSPELRGHPYMLMHFGKGPRMCIGSRIVDFKFQSVLSQLLQRYEIRQKEGSPATIGSQSPSLVNKPDREVEYEFKPLA